MNWRKRSDLGALNICSGKPASSISKAQNTVTVDNEAEVIEVHGRHDPCICPRVVPVIEAMTALTIMDCWLIQEAIAAGRRAVC